MLRYVPRLQKPLSVMVWAGISASGRTPLVFVPSGVKINISTYRELILEPVVKNLEQTVFNGKSFVFQQDGAFRIPTRWKFLVVELGKVPQEVLRAVVEALPGRVTAVIKNEGGYIE